MAEEFIGLTPDGTQEVWQDPITGAISYKKPDDKRKKPQTEFERRVAAERAKGSDLTDAADVALLLKRAGVSDQKIAEIQANPSQIAFFKANPDLIAPLAERFPAAYTVNYYQARTAAGLGPFPQPLGPSALNPELAAAQRGAGPSLSPTGAQSFEGGVFVHDGQVFFPPTDASIMGSPAWMAEIPNWDDAKRQTWAKTLKQMGYIDSLKVDLKTFTVKLQEYHDNRYLYGGGKPVDVSAGRAGITKDDFGGILDPAVVDTEVIAYHKEIYGANDEPSEEEKRRGREFLTKTALRLARNKDLAPADAASVASARAQRRFLADPATRKWQDLEETDTSLHDSFVNLFQVLSR